MTNSKTNLPPYAEEQIINQKIKIPTNFVELGQIKKYWGSTEGLDKPLCERYTFKYDNKSITLDITQELSNKLGLKENESFPYLVYINRDLLRKKPEEGGITVDNEKEIICQTEGTILVQEKEIQVDFTSGEITDLKQKLKKSEELSQETQTLLEKVLKDNEEKHIAIIFFEEEIKNLTQRITELRRDLEQEIIDKKREISKNQELERIIRNLKENEQVLIGLQKRISDMQKELAGERLMRGRAEQDLQTRTEERDARPNIIQGQYGNEILEYLRQIAFLKREIGRLDDIIELLEKLTEKELNENQDNINSLKTQRDNLQTRANNLNGTLRQRDQIITNLRSNLVSESNARTRAESEVSRLNGENNSLRSQLSSAQSNYDYYYRQYREKDREVDNLRSELSNLSSQISSLRSENNRLREKSIDNYKKEYISVVESIDIAEVLPSRKGKYRAFRVDELGYFDRKNEYYGDLPLSRVIFNYRRNMKVIILNSGSPQTHFNC